MGVVSVAAHPAGALAASSSLDSFIRVFEVESNASIATLEAPPSARAPFLAVAGGSSASVKLWDISTWHLIGTLVVPHPESNRPSDRTGSGKFVLSVTWSGSMDGTIAIFDVGRAKFLHHLDGRYMPVRSLVFSSVESRVLFTACDDTHIHMYDAEGKSLVGAMSGHATWVLSIDVSPDGLALAAGSSDRTVRMWDVGLRTSMQTMMNHTNQVWGVAFRPPGGTGVWAGRLASVSDDKSISSYDY